jgi:prolipoprotein diacylglyceryltransferase
VGPSGDSASLARLCIMGEFFISWFIHAIGVSVFSVFAAAAIMGTRKFFVGDEFNDDTETLVFYVVMTVLVGAFAIAIVANAPRDDEDTRLLLSPLFS